MGIGPGEELHRALQREGPRLEGLLIRTKVISWAEADERTLRTANIEVAGRDVNSVGNQQRGGVRWAAIGIIWRKGAAWRTLRSVWFVAHFRGQVRVIVVELRSVIDILTTTV